MIYGYFTLLVALIISSIAEYYSIIGLTAIFSSAFWPIVIMGAALGVGKITAAVWLKLNWHRASFVYKMYLVPAVAVLMLLTSIGCFGYLSKAHSDQSLVSSDSVAKVAIYDEKIATAKDNIDANRKALRQMDEAVDQVMSRSQDEKGADKAVQIRRSQQKERARLQSEIAQEQATIAKLNEEAAPLRAEFRKVENEVGPIKYIAALIYGDNPDANILEKAVRLVIIIIVAVFDPLALVLILAAQQSLRWAKEEQKEQEEHKPDAWVADVGEKPTKEELEQVEELPSSDLVAKTESVKEEDAFEPIQCNKCGTNLLNAPGIGPFCPNKLCDVLDGWKIEDNEPDTEKSMLEQHPYLNKGFAHFENLQPVVYKPEVIVEEKPKKKRPVPRMTVKSKTAISVEEPKIEITVDEITADTELNIEDVHRMEVKQDLPFKELPGGYVSFEGKHMNKDALFSMHPEFLRLSIDANKPINSSFGTKFPDIASKGDIYTRVDVLPNKVYKYDGGNWININKDTSNTYLYNTKYLDYLIEVIEKGEYDPELLSENEKSQLEDYLKINKINRKI